MNNQLRQQLQINNIQTRKDHSWALLFLGLATAPICAIVISFLYSSLSLLTAVLLAAIFRDAYPFVLMAVPFFFAVLSIGVPLAALSITNPWHIAFAQVSIVTSSAVIAFNLADHFISEQDDIGTYLYAGTAAFFSGIALIILVGLHERHWNLYVNKIGIAATGIVFLAGAILSTQIR